MKRLIIFTALLTGLTTVSANVVTVSTVKDVIKTNRYQFAQPISFIERGVEFLIFPDGSFDFNTNFENTTWNNEPYYRQTNSRRGSINATFGAPGTTTVNYTRQRNHFYVTNGMLILHDREGKVRRIGNVFLNYDRIGRIKRIGPVYIGYNRHRGILNQVGGLHIKYNHKGEIIFTSGYVNRFNKNTSCYTSTTNQFGNSFNDFDLSTPFNNDFYYYRQGDAIKKKRKLKR